MPSTLFGKKKTKRQGWHRDPHVWRPDPYPSAISSAVSWSCSDESSCHAVLPHLLSPAVRRFHSWIGSPESQHRGTVLGAAIAHWFLDCCAPADWLTVAVPSDPSDAGWASTDSGGARAFQCLFLQLPAPTSGMTGARRMRKVKESVSMRHLAAGGTFSNTSKFQRRNLLGIDMSAPRLHASCCPLQRGVVAR